MNAPATVSAHDRRPGVHRRARALDWRAIEDLHVTRLVTDSRHVAPGDTFVAYPGESRDGRDFIPQSLERGASSVLWERDGFAWRPEWRAKNAPITDLRRRAGEIASDV